MFAAFTFPIIERLAGFFKWLCYDRGVGAGKRGIVTEWHRAVVRLERERRLRTEADWS